MPLAKPAAKLNRQDLADHPVWQWLDDVGAGSTDTDESFVRPAILETAPFAQYLVAATATLRDGSQLPACVAVTFDRRRVICAPEFVLMLDRQLPFVGNETERLLSRFTKTAANRPVRWRLARALPGERQPREGSVRRSLTYLIASFALRAALARMGARR